MINELIKAFILIFIAEMGDKTQILAMAFATKYNIKKVLVGVCIGSALNHGIAVILGAYLSNVIPINTIQLIAGISFIGFGLWALKPEEAEDEDKSKKDFGPIVTVAIAFFIGELGDKTQLTALTLATDAQYPVIILMGTVLGMVVTSSFGIFVGSKLGEKIPEFTMKLASSSVFIFFGLLKLYQTVPSQYITIPNIMIFFIILSIPIYILLKSNIRVRKAGRISALEEAATSLYIHTNQIKEAVEDICLGEKNCGNCKGRDCLIGFTKRALESANEEGEYILPDEWSSLPDRDDKNFNEKKVIEALSMTIYHLKEFEDLQNENHAVNKTREALEIILFGEKIYYTGDIKEYFKSLKKRDLKLALRIINRVKVMEEREKDN